MCIKILCRLERGRFEHEDFVLVQVNCSIIHLQVNKLTVLGRNKLNRKLKERRQCIITLVLA